MAEQPGPERGEDEREAEYAAFDVWSKANETRRRMPEWCRAIAEAAWVQGARRARAREKVLVECLKGIRAQYDGFVPSMVKRIDAALAAAG